MTPRKVSWHGVLSFGMVSIPVGLDPATNPTAKASNISFKTIHKTCLTPIKQKKWCPECELELGADDVGKGWQEVKGEPLVLVDEAQLDALKGESSSDMPISAFVPFEQVDPIWFDRTYFLFPGEKADGYATLLQIMQDTARGGICHYTRSGQEKIGFLRPLQGIIGMETLFVAEDLRASDASVDYVPTTTDMSIATQLVELLSEDFDGDMLSYEYRENLNAMLESIVMPQKKAAKPKIAKVPDMQDVLKASVKAIKEQKKQKKAA